LLEIYWISKPESWFLIFFGHSMSVPADG